MSRSDQAGDVPWVGREQLRRTGVGTGAAARCDLQGAGPGRVPRTASRLSPCVLCPRSAFDLVNIHLFHDASNLVAWETSPSVYSGIRHKALGYVLDR